MQLEAIS